MNTDHNVIEFSEPLVIAEHEERWNKGDKFALIEAAAFCHLEDCALPVWVQSEIGRTMLDLYRSVYGDVDPFQPNRQEAEAILADDDRQLSDRFLKARVRTELSLGLSEYGKNAVTERKRLLRDAHLADQVARYCQYTGEDEQPFKGVNKAIRQILAELQDEDNNYHPSCQGVDSEDMVKRAWRKHKVQISRYFKSDTEWLHSPLAWLFDPTIE
jgi:hypothetical protein